jgi:hypothetical protein
MVHHQDGILLRDRAFLSLRVNSPLRFLLGPLVNSVLVPLEPPVQPLASLSLPPSFQVVIRLQANL